MPSRPFSYVAPSPPMNRFILLAPALLLSACSERAAEQPAAAATSDADGQTDMTTPVVSPSAPSPSQRVSRYTRLDDCKVVKTQEDEDWAVLRCEAQGGIGLTLNYYDARDDLELVRPGRPPVQIGIPNLAGGGFNKLGDTVEWCGTVEGGAFRPDALIVRNNAIENSERPERSTSFLTVIDIAQGCAVAQVRPGSGQNERARKIADWPGRPCLREGGAPP